ncbi:undecaprenyl-phosphate glucose phosphotransferase [Anoxybacterium hadale]|uniref:Undecaprenyl-phosphate glucose phosphotransferase n=1 Tax=Anoxybacterium hadale TaxID=3408580 RepID=A0ACD1AFK1_9FIRM|nr:undecaprenyl-phosphate glucose phosphotransferase [Clostridiales bacterium]
MIRENQRIFNTVQILADAFIFLTSMGCAYFLRFYRYEGGHIRLEFYLQLCVVAIPIYLLIFNYYQLYESYRSKRLLLEIGRIIKANFAGIIFIFLLSFLIKEVNISRMVILLFGFFNTICMLISRIALRKTLRAFRRKGYNIKRLLIIGCSNLSMDFSKKIMSNKNLGYFVVGFLSNKMSACDVPPFPYGIPHKGTFSDLEEVIAKEGVDEAVVALEYDQYDALPDIIEICEKSGTKVSVIPFYTKYLPARPYIDEVEGLPVINIRRIPLDNLLNNWAKRLFDVFSALVLIILLSPILLAAALGVKLSSPGPILYKQERVGLNKKNFMMYKFRSMKMASDGSDKTAWSTRNDPRKTKFGTFIRKYSIDELPQLFNVLEGTMSLVGPRPEIPYHVYNFKEQIPLYMVKHQVRPGITGWAQVNGLRGDTSIKKRIEHDIFYIENWSFLFDLKILIMTIFKGVVNQSE